MSWFWNAIAHIPLEGSHAIYSTTVSTVDRQETIAKSLLISSFMNLIDLPNAFKLSKTWEVWFCIIYYHMGEMFLIKQLKQSSIDRK